MSTIRTDTILHSSGSTTTQPSIPALDQRMAKAWVNFNGTGTVAIRDSYNVSSITDNGVGDYTANFAVAMADPNYSYALSGVGSWLNHMAYGSSVSGIQVRRVDNSNYNNYDAATYTVIILGS